MTQTPQAHSDPRLGTPRRIVRRSPGSGETNRSLLLRLIEAQPGIGFRELVRESGLAAGTVSHHARKLERMRLAWRARQANHLVHFPGPRPGDQAMDRALRLAAANRVGPDVYGVVLARPGIMQLEVIAQFPSMSRSTVQHQLRRLVELGVLRSRRCLRSVRYEVVA